MRKGGCQVRREERVSGKEGRVSGEDGGYWG